GVFGAVAVLVGHWLFRGLGHRIAQNRGLLGLGIAAVVAVTFYAYKIRPDGGPQPPRVHPAAAREGRMPMRRTLNAYFPPPSFRWFAWYLGTFTLALIVIGFLVLTVRALRSDSPAFLLLAAAGPVTVLYVGRPSISPDQLWAMRRYLPMVLPVMTIAAAAAAPCGVAWLAARLPLLRGPPAVLVPAPPMLPAAKAGGPIPRPRRHRGALDAVHEICKRAGPDGAVAIEPEGLLAITLAQPVRGFCGVPAAGVQRHPARPVGSDLAD